MGQEGGLRSSGAHLTVRGMVARPPTGALWCAPLAVVACLAAAMGSVVASLPAPPAPYLEVPRLVGVLLAAPLVAAAAALGWRRSATAARPTVAAWHGVRLRGASNRLLVWAVLWSWLPQLVAAAIAAVAASVLAIAVDPGGRAPGHAILWAGAAALVVAVAALGGHAAAFTAPPYLDDRGRSGRESWHAGWWCDALILTAGAGIAWALWRQGGVATETAMVAQAQAVFGGSLLGPSGAETVAPLQPLPALRVLLLIGPPLFLVGLAGASGYILSLGARLLDALGGASVPSVPLVTVRALARGSYARRLAPPLALAIAVLAFLVFGCLGLARSERVLQDVRLGADVALPVSWASPCPVGQPRIVVRPASGVPLPKPAGDVACQSPSRVPLPDVSGAAAHIPGTVAATLLVTVTEGAGVPIEYVGVDPRTFGATVHWPAGVPGPEATALADLTAGEAIISPQLAVVARLQTGDTLPGMGLAAPPVGLVLPAWPGLGTSQAVWAVVNWQELAPILQVQGVYARAGLSGRLLLRLAPHAALSRVLRAVASPAMRVASPRLPVGAGGLGPVALPAGAAVVLALGLIWLAHCATATDEPEGLPDGLALDALAAGEEVRSARRSLVWVARAWGAAWGLLSGTVAAAVFWPDLRLGLSFVPPLPFLADWSGLGLGILVAAVGLLYLARVLARAPADPRGR